MAYVDNVAPARTKEERPIESTLAVAQRASNKKLAIGGMDKRLVPVGLEETDIPNPSNPHFDIVGQENKIVAMKDERLMPPSGPKRLIRLFSNFCQRTHVLLKGSRLQRSDDALEIGEATDTIDRPAYISSLCLAYAKQGA